MADVTTLDKVNGSNGNWSNYRLTTTGPLSTNAAITPKDVTLTALSADDKTYDGNTVASITSGTVQGTISGETLSVSGTGQFDDANAGDQKTVTVADVTTLNQVNGNNGNWANYRLVTTGPLNTSAAIAKKSATVTANSRTVTYNGQVQSATGFTATGLIAGENESILADVHTSGGSGRNAGNYAHTADGSSTNYSLTFVNGALTITSKSLDIDGTVVADKGFDGQTTANITQTGILQGLVEGEDLILSAQARFADAAPADGKPVTVNYELGNGANGWAPNYSLRVNPIVVRASIKGSTLAPPTQPDAPPEPGLPRVLVSNAGQASASTATASSENACKSGQACSCQSGSAGVDVCIGSLPQ